MPIDIGVRSANFKSKAKWLIQWFSVEIEEPYQQKTHKLKEISKERRIHITYDHSLALDLKTCRIRMNVLMTMRVNGKFANKEPCISEGATIVRPRPSMVHKNYRAQARGIGEGKGETSMSQCGRGKERWNNMYTLRNQRTFIEVRAPYQDMQSIGLQCRVVIRDRVNRFEGIKQLIVLWNTFWKRFEWLQAYLLLWLRKYSQHICWVP